MWKIKLGEGQHLYTRCIAIPVLTSFVRNVQPPQTICTERLTHFFPHVVVMSASSTDLLSIYFLLGKKTPTGSKGWAYRELPPGFATLCTEMYQRPLAAPLLQAFCSQQQYHRDISVWIWPRNGLIQHKENCLCKATVHHKRVSAGKLNVHCVESQHHTENNTHWGHYAVQSLHTYKTGKLFLWPTSSVLTICPNIPDICCKKSSTKA